MLFRGYNLVFEPLTGEEESHVRSLYVKEHRASGEGKGRTLFIGNVDDKAGVLEEEVIKARLALQWGAVGKIESIELGYMSADGEDSSSGDTDGPTMPLRFAHVRFTNTKQLKRALLVEKLPWIDPVVEDDHDDDDDEAEAGHGRDPSRLEGVGFAGAKKRYRESQPQRAHLLQEVDSFMANFEEAEAAEAAALKGRPRMDADGFEIVTHKRKRGRMPGMGEPGDGSGGGGGGGDAGGGGRRKKKKATTELKNFYSFQRRDEKISKLATLREKFEEDKKRITRMKEARKFKPF